MTTKASEIIDRLEEKLNDLGNVRWTVEELIRSINDGQKMILEADPSLFEYFDSVPVQQGSRQQVPDDCYLLFDVEELNLSGVFVSTPRKIKKSVMDRQIPGWIGAASGDRIDHWCQEQSETNYFFINPPVTPASHTLRLRYAKYPDPVTSGTDDLSVQDESINGLYYFCMMRCLEKDEKFAGSAQSARFAQMFVGTFGARSQGDTATYIQRAKEEDVE